jgi:hypothetical protein
MTVTIIGPRDPRVLDAINTTTHSTNWGKGLSPFIVGPVPLYQGAVTTQAWNVENAWQYSKVYQAHADPAGNPTDAYFKWAKDGWDNHWANRYPMGKGAKPLYCLWAGKHLGYIEARKRVFARLYATTVVQTKAFDQLLKLYKEQKDITLWDFDGYDHRALGMTYQDVLNCETRTMGHAFILAMLLERLGA